MSILGYRQVEQNLKAWEVARGDGAVLVCVTRLRALVNFGARYGQHFTPNLAPAVPAPGWADGRLTALHNASPTTTDPRKGAPHPPGTGGRQQYMLLFCLQTQLHHKSPSAYP